MDSLIFELQIVFYFQLFLSANVRHICFFKTNFQLDRILHFVFFCVVQVIKIAALESTVVPSMLVSFFFFDGLTVQASFVQSSFYVQSIKIIVLL